jgi:acetyltransferase-like isoleucine patch superfamily enzyme
MPGNYVAAHGRFTYLALEGGTGDWELIDAHHITIGPEVHLWSGDDITIECDHLVIHTNQIDEGWIMQSDFHVCGSITFTNFIPPEEFVKKYPCIEIIVKRYKSAQS